MPAKYLVNLMFEWGGGCLWCGNHAALGAFDVGPIEDGLPLSSGTRHRMKGLSAWHDMALDWDDPGGSSPWPPEEFERFERAALLLLETIREELGPDFEVTYKRLG